MPPMNFLTTLFLAVLLLATLLRVWLDGRQIRHVRRHRDAVPMPFAADISPAAHRKAADYTVARTRLDIGRAVGESALALAWTLGGGLARLDAAWRTAGLGALPTGVSVLASFALINALVELPLSAYATFGIEARYGFNRMGLKTFFLDRLKALFLAALLGVPLLYAALWLMQAGGRLWWLWVWGLWTAFSLFLAWAWPVLFAPLFNQFTPLADAALRERLEALLSRCGFASRGVFVMDGSARSAHGNAYFSGFGRHKRIVFFDTLMERLAPEEIEAVLAHELGHFRLRHVLKRLLFTAATSLAGLASLGQLAAHEWFYRGLGVPQPSTYLALALFVLFAPPFLFLLEPLASAWSRRHEFAADRYAAEQSDALALKRALVKLYRDNAATLTPDPLHSAFYDSHPPAAVRIARLEQQHCDATSRT